MNISIVTAAVPVTDTSITETGQKATDVTKLAESYAAFLVANAISTYVTPTVVIVGLVGNTLSLLVMLRPANRHISCCVYMAALAVSDNLSLLPVGLLIIAGNLPAPMLTYTLCSTAIGFGQTFMLVGVVLVVSMTLDRWLAVRFPLKAVVWCSVKRAKVTTAIVVILSAVYNLPYFLYSTTILNGWQCRALSIKNRFTKLYTWISVAINSVIPFTVLLVFNVLIIQLVLSRKDFFKQDKKQPSIKDGLEADHGKGGGGVKAKSEQKKVDVRERQLMIMLILVSIALLTQTLPMYIRYIVFALVDFSGTPSDYANYLLIFHSTRTLFFSNNAFNFFLYCLGGSKFRQDLVSLFCQPCCKKEKSERRAMSTLSTSLSSST